MEQNKKFLQFNGKNVYFISANGIWFIAIKPICDALGVNYNRQFQNIKSDEILGPAFAVQQMQVNGNQERNYGCLPEFYIYGWLFNIQSTSADLKEFKWKCYELLYNYFHGSITERDSFLKVKTLTQLKIEKLERELEDSETYKELQKLKAETKSVQKTLRSLDKNHIFSQLPLWQAEIPEN